MLSNCSHYLIITPFFSWIFYMARFLDFFKVCDMRNLVSEGYYPYAPEVCKLPFIRIRNVSLVSRDLE